MQLVSLMFEGNWEFCRLIRYIYLSLMVKTSKSDQGSFYSTGHVRFITTETGKYLHSIDIVSEIVFVCTTCAVLKVQIERPDITVSTCRFKSLFQGLHASLKSN